jgi:hypothetical protein
MAVMVIGNEKNGYWVMKNNYRKKDNLAKGMPNCDDILLTK